jgi:hypothetical protein
MPLTHSPDVGGTYSPTEVAAMARDCARRAAEAWHRGDKKTAYHHASHAMALGWTFPRLQKPKPAPKHTPTARAVNHADLQADALASVTMSSSKR